MNLPPAASGATKTSVPFAGFPPTRLFGSIVRNAVGSAGGPGGAGVGKSGGRLDLVQSSKWSAHSSADSHVPRHAPIRWQVLMGWISFQPSWAESKTHS